LDLDTALPITITLLKILLLKMIGDASEEAAIARKHCKVNHLSIEYPDPIASQIQSQSATPA
jgi:hypothetical protein